MLTLMLAEAEIELMPVELARHPAVIAHARQRRKQPTKILLDSNYHHPAMTNLPEGRRRGRPDITHLFLLTALESIVNKKGQLNILDSYEKQYDYHGKPRDAYHAQLRTIPRTHRNSF